MLFLGNSGLRPDEALSIAIGDVTVEFDEAREALTAEEIAKLNQISRLVLGDASTAHILDDATSQRILDAISPEGTDDEPIRAEGLSRSVENLATVAGRKVLSEAGEIGKAVSTNVKTKAAEEISGATVGYLKKNSGPLLELARVRGAEWLEMFLGWLDGM